MVAADVWFLLFQGTWPVNIALHLALNLYDTQNVCQYVYDVYLNADLNTQTTSC